MKITILFLLCILFPAIGIADIIHVPGDHASIQDAILAALDGDTVLVAPGTYSERLNFLGRKISVASEQGPAVTFIDAGKAGTVVVFNNGEGASSVLEGFTLTNGSANKGGGVYCLNVSPTITGNHIRDNHVAYGGGIYCEGSHPKIEGNEITGNSGFEAGGGICCRADSSPSIHANTITLNMTKYHGGGIECRDNGAPTLIGNTITSNYTTYGFSYGGGICCRANAKAKIVGNHIADNTSVFTGGGIYEDGASLTIKNNVIVRNTAQNNYGGGVASTGNSSTTLTGNLIADNSAGKDGGGIYTWYTDVTTITGNTIVNNSAGTQGGGINCGAWCEDRISNCIIWGNTAPNGSQLFMGHYGSPSTCHIDYCNIEYSKPGVFIDGNCDLYWGLNMYTGDPDFVDAAAGDYHLLYSSFCRDIGSGLAEGLTSEDFEGDPRKAYGGVDLGADEFHPHLYCMGEALPGGVVQIKMIGLPGTDLWLLKGSGVLDPAVLTDYGTFFLADPVLAFHFPRIPANGLRVFRPRIPASFPAPASIPLQGFMGELTNFCSIQIK